MTDSHFEADLLSGRIVYGPFHARRRGTVVGVNLLPEDVKICNFDCIYCHCGLSDSEDLKRLELCPPIEAVRRAIAERLTELAAEKRPLDTILISGNGEPTLYPQFPEAVEAVVVARDRICPGTPVAVLTNGTLLHKSAIRDALATVDRTIVKFDAGPATLFDAIDRPVYRFGFEQLQSGCAALGHFTLQSIFLQGIADNTTDEAVADWIDKVAHLRPDAVEIYGLDRPAPVEGVTAAAESRLLEIRDCLSSRTGVSAEVFD